MELNSQLAKKSPRPPPALLPGQLNAGSFFSIVGKPANLCVYTYVSIQNKKAVAVHLLVY